MCVYICILQIIRNVYIGIYTHNINICILKIIRNLYIGNICEYIGKFCEYVF